MGSRRVFVMCLRTVLAGLAVLAGLTGAAAQIDTLQQPRGVPIPGLTGVPIIDFGFQANTYPPLGATPTTLPFANAEPAGVVRTTETTEYYVRFYTPPTTAPNRAWIMRASTARGLTPEQIRDRFALPYMPTYITNVLVPTGTCLLSGIAGPSADRGLGAAAARSRPGLSPATPLIVAARRSCR